MLWSFEFFPFWRELEFVKLVKGRSDYLQQVASFDATGIVNTWLIWLELQYGKTRFIESQLLRNISLISWQV